tara:strand:+ start:398 stop:610 length:213 start_codon:yes stop_codon:yes gene_type:complete
MTKQQMEEISNIDFFNSTDFFTTVSVVKKFTKSFFMGLFADVIEYLHSIGDVKRGNFFYAVWCSCLNDMV